MASLTNDILYTKTGVGTSASNPGFENGPFQKWETQPSENVGYLSDIDQTHRTIFKELVPEVVFGGWLTKFTPNNTVAMPRGNIYQDSEFEQDYTLTEQLQFAGRAGSKDTVYLKYRLRVSKIFQKFELESTGTNAPEFEMREAIRGMARAYENITVADIISQGTQIQEDDATTHSGHGCMAWFENEAGTEYTACDIYKTVLNIRTKLVNQGNQLPNIDFYVTPEIITDLMLDSHFISNGQSNIQSAEVRNGFAGRLLGFDFYESGRLYQMTNLNPAYKQTGKPESEKVNLVVVDRTEVILCRHVVKTLSMVPAPNNYIECMLLTGLEYFKHYVVNSYSVLYANTRYLPVHA